MNSAPASGAASQGGGATFRHLIAERGQGRTARFRAAIRAAVYEGLLPGDAEEAMRRAPEGCASKFLAPVDRLVPEIVEAWRAVEAEASEEPPQPILAPTYPSCAVPVEKARQAVHDAIAAHLAAGAGHRAIRVGTGVGKTKAAAQAIAEDIRRRRAEGDRSAALYCVPSHKLGKEVAALFEAEGLRASVFRGRTADDPDAPETGLKMCLDLEAVSLAVTLGRTVSTSCCRGRHPKTNTIVQCPLFDACGYQRQTRESPDIWVAAHDLLFSAPGGLGEIGSVTVDEGFLETGLRLGKRGITLDDLGAPPPVGRTMLEEMDAADIAAWRSTLVAALRRQEDTGGVERRHLVEGGVDVVMCARANAAEWLLKGRVTLWPGMPPAARRAAMDQAATTARVSAFSGVWDAARGLLRQDDPDIVSGRLVLVDKPTEDGSGRARSVLTHGLRHVLQKWRDLPILLLDATLPSIEVLRRFLPNIEIVADIEATTPHATVRQVLGAPTSAGKLMRSDVGRNREAVRRAILHRFVEAGRCPTLVVCQLELETWLVGAGMPEGITVAHFGAIAGLDGFKDVGLLIVVGRTMPNPFEVEAMSGVISGIAPVRTAEPERGPRWYDRTRLALRMTDGTGHPVDGDRHPDPIAEAMRWQVAEAGVLQGLGRARGVNRSAANPVTIEIWNELALPVTIDEVVAWTDITTGHEADMLVDGIGLESAPDMAACWPRIWETARAAERWRQKLTDTPNPISNIFYRAKGICDARKSSGQGVVEFVYQHPGGRQKWRRGWYVPAVCPDPRGWLEGRLGIVLAGFEVLAGDEDEQ